MVQCLRLCVMTVVVGSLLSSAAIVEIPWCLSGGPQCGSPGSTPVNAGDTVIWRWGDTLPHSVTSKFAPAFPASPLLTGQNMTYEHTFDTAGSYQYFCGIHTNSMSGTIVVSSSTAATTTVAAAAAAPTATATPVAVVAASNVFSIDWCVACGTFTKHIQLGDTVKWTLRDSATHTVDISLNGSIVAATGPISGVDTTFTQQFTTPGDYYVECLFHPTTMKGFVFVNSTTTATLSSVRPYLVAHGAVMFVAFGILLPLGGYLAVNRKIHLHRWVQPTGLVVALIGFILAIIGVEEHHGGFHLAVVHAYVGIVLVVLAILFQPVFVLFRNKYATMHTYHKRNGQFIIFFGIANVFMGLIALNAATVFKVTYGCYVALMIMFYMLYQPDDAHFKRDGKTGRLASLVPGAGEAPINNHVQMTGLRLSHSNTSETIMMDDLDRRGSAATSVDKDFAGAAEQNRMHLLAALETSNDAIVGSDNKGLITSWNGAATRMFGYEEAEVLGKSMQIIIPHSLRAAHQSGIDRNASASASGRKPKRFAKIYEVRGVHADGNEFPCEVSVTSYLSNGTVHFTGVIRDLSVERTQEHVDPRFVAIRAEAKRVALLGNTLQRMYKLNSAEYITEDEMARVLHENINSNKLKLNDEQHAQMVRAIMSQADDPTHTTVSMRKLMQLFDDAGIRVDAKGTVVSRGNTLPRRETEKLTGWEKFKRRARNEYVSWIWLFLFACVNGGLFAWRYIEFDTPAYSGWVKFSRGTGMMLNFCCAFILFTMSRSFLTYVRKFSWLNRAVPVDLSIEFHKIIAMVILFASLVHGVCHLGNYATIQGTTVSALLFNTNAGLTGFILWVIIAFMFTGALPFFRRSMRHNFFFFTHYLFVAFYIVLLIHGLDHINPNFWKFFLLPGTIYILERLIRYKKAKTPVAIVLAEGLASKVTHLEFQRPDTFRYTAGQYLFVNIPTIAKYEWHPFTISSAPGDATVSIHVRSAGDWTGCLYDTFSPGLMSNAPPPVCYIDGPYGTPTEEVFDFKVAVLVGAGIGSTPAASILKHVKMRLTNKGGCTTPSCQCRCSCCRFRLEKLYFIWMQRDVKAFEWFADFLSELQAADVNHFLELRVFLTGGKMPKEDLSAVMMHIAIEQSMEQTGQDVLTSLASRTEFGRPDWNIIFPSIARRHNAPGTDIGVFFCGPPALGSMLRKMSSKHSTPGGTSFKYRQEIF